APAEASLRARGWSQDRCRRGTPDDEVPRIAARACRCVRIELARSRPSSTRSDALRLRQTTRSQRLLSQRYAEELFLELIKTIAQFSGLFEFEIPRCIEHLFFDAL